MPEDEIEKALSTCFSKGIQAFSIADEEYPPLLRAIPDPPAVLFIRGSVHCLSSRTTVGIIGSRRCSIYGRNIARKLSAALCSAGACIISGLARGIDSEAHRGALNGGGPTAAVFGGGLDTVYPPEHLKLADKITAAGCLVSEYPPGVKPARYTFPERNRIISGLSTAIVVVEAGEKSGTMITVGTALDQGRDVYAVPGEVGSFTSRGTNRLIRDGAGIVLSCSELLSDLGLQESKLSVETDNPLSNALKVKGKTVEQLAAALGTPSEEVQRMLLALELEGAVIRRPGNIFTLV